MLRFTCLSLFLSLVAMFSQNTKQRKEIIVLRLMYGIREMGRLNKKYYFSRLEGTKYIIF